MSEISIFQQYSITDVVRRVAEGTLAPEEIAAALFWLGTEEDALPLAKSYTMIDLQPLHKERVARAA